MSDQDSYDLIKQGDRCWKRGDFGNAFAYWEKAEKLAAQQKKPSLMLQARQRLDDAMKNIANDQKMSLRKVFVGSCMDELINEREGIQKALESRRIETFVFENRVGAKPEDSVRDIWESELISGTVYVGIFWKRYGKYTVEECEYALAKGLPCFIYVTDRHAIPGAHFKRDEELQAFLDKLNGLAGPNVESVIRVMGKFKNAFDLPDKVVNDIIDWLRETRQHAQRALMLAESDRRTANQQITNLEAEIARLNNMFELLAPNRTLDIKAQIAKLEDEAAIVQLRLNEIQRSIVTFESIIVDRTWKIMRLDGLDSLDKFFQRISTKPKIFIANTGSPDTYIFLQLGDKQYELGDFASALKWYQAAVSSAVAGRNGELILLARLRIANTWRWVPDVKQTIENAASALALAHAQKNRHAKAMAALYMLETLAVWNLRGRWAEIRPMLLDGITEAHKFADDHLEAVYLICLGECMTRLRELEMALTYLQKALYIAQQIEPRSVDWQCRIYQTFSALSLLREDYGEGCLYATLAIGIAREGKRPYFIASAQLALARVEQAGGDILAADTLALEVLELSKLMGWQGLEQEAQSLLSESK